jgi:hypothetical protein
MSNLDGVLVSCTDVATGSTEMGVLAGDAVYWNDVRYRCSQYLAALIASGSPDAHLVHDASVRVEVDRSSPFDIDVVVCGHREKCLIDRFNYDKTCPLLATSGAIHKANQVTIGTKSPGKTTQETLAFLSRRNAPTSNLPTVLRLQTGLNRARERHPKPSGARYAGKVNRAVNRALRYLEKQS